MDEVVACQGIVKYMWVFVYLAIVMTLACFLVIVDIVIDKKDLDQDKHRGPSKKDK